MLNDYRLRVWGSAPSKMLLLYDGPTRKNGFTVPAGYTLLNVELTRNARKDSTWEYVVEGAA